jgi:hypothetical protein
MAVYRQCLRRRDPEVVACKPVDDMDREIEIGDGRPCADHPAVVDDLLVKRQPDGGIALLKQRAEGRIGGDAAAIEDAGLGKQECAGAGRGEQRRIFGE